MPLLPGSLFLPGDAVLLRDWALEDESALETICGDPELMPFTSIPRVFSSSAARAWIRLQRQRRSEGTAISLAVVSSVDNAAVGNVNLVRFSDDGREAAIGYWTIPQERQKGFATEAVRTMSAWAFNEIGLQRLEFSVAPHNHASIAVARAVGARETGTRMVQPTGLKDPIEFLKYTLVAADLADG